MGHPTPVRVRGVDLTVLGEFETGGAPDDALVMPLALAQRVYGRPGTSGAWIRARLSRAALERAVRDVLGRPVAIVPVRR